jgi:hypothetical protein
MIDDGEMRLQHLPVQIPATGCLRPTRSYSFGYVYETSVMVRCKGWKGMFAMSSRDLGVERERQSAEEMAGVMRIPSGYHIAVE